MQSARHTSAGARVIVEQEAIATATREGSEVIGDLANVVTGSFRTPVHVWLHRDGDRETGLVNNGVFINPDKYSYGA